MRRRPIYVLCHKAAGTSFITDNFSLSRKEVNILFLSRPTWHQKSFPNSRHVYIYIRIWKIYYIFYRRCGTDGDLLTRVPRKKAARAKVAESAIKTQRCEIPQRFSETLCSLFLSVERRPRTSAVSICIKRSAHQTNFSLCFCNDSKCVRASSDLWTADAAEPPRQTDDTLCAENRHIK